MCTCRQNCEHERRQQRVPDRLGLVQCLASLNLPFATFSFYRNERDIGNASFDR